MQGERTPSSAHCLESLPTQQRASRSCEERHLSSAKLANSQPDKTPLSMSLPDVNVAVPFKVHVDASFNVNFTCNVNGSVNVDVCVYVYVCVKVVGVLRTTWKNDQQHSCRFLVEFLGTFNMVSRVKEKRLSFVFVVFFVKRLSCDQCLRDQTDNLRETRARVCRCW